MAFTHSCIIGYIRRCTVQQTCLTTDIYNKLGTLCYEYINGDTSAPNGITKIRVHCRKDDEDKQFSCFVGQQINDLYDDLLFTAKVKFSIKPNSLNVLHHTAADGHKSYLEDLGDLIDKLDDTADNNDNYLNLYIENTNPSTSEKQQSPQPYIIPLSLTNSISPPSDVLQDTPTIDIPHLSPHSPVLNLPAHFRGISDSTVQSELSSSSDSDSVSELYDSELDSDTNTKTFSDTVPDDFVLNQYGYKVINTINHTLNGCLYKAQTITNAICNKNIKWSHLTSSKFEKHVAVKKVFKDRIDNDVDNGITISKEAMILHYLTVLNKPPRNNICNFIEFIETESEYFLVEEYGAAMTLGKFTESAHKYMKQKRLTKKEWRVFVKYVFWQLVVNIYWMHYDMHCCHLDLNMDNILIKNAYFALKNGDGDIRIESKGLMIKICDFKQSEVFPLNKGLNAFKCIKRGISNSEDCMYKSPQLYKGDTFNAIKADTWSLGVILHTLCTCAPPYIRTDSSDEGYCAIKDNKLGSYLGRKGFGSYISKQAVRLMVNLLNIDENKRLNTEQILRWDWFENYYTQSRFIINRKSKTQKLRHIRQQKQMKQFPFYDYDYSIL